MTAATQPAQPNDTGFVAYFSWTDALGREHHQHGPIRRTYAEAQRDANGSVPATVVRVRTHWPRAAERRQPGSVAA